MTEKDCRFVKSFRPQHCAQTNNAGAPILPGNRRKQRMIWLCKDDRRQLSMRTGSMRYMKSSSSEAGVTTHGAVELMNRMTILSQVM